MAKHKILVIEDDLEIQELITYHLVRAGFLVTYHVSGEAGLDEIKRGQPNLAVIDLTLPGMDGWAVARQLQNNPETASLPLVMLTANGEENNGRAVAPSVCIAKPINPEALLTCIRSLLQPGKRKAKARPPRGITARKAGKRS